MLKEAQSFFTSGFTAWKGEPAAESYTITHGHLTVTGLDGQPAPLVVSSGNLVLSKHVQSREVVDGAALKHAFESLVSAHNLLVANYNTLIRLINDHQKVSDILTT